MQTLLEVVGIARCPPTPLQGGAQSELGGGELSTVSEALPEQEQPQDSHAHPQWRSSIQVRVEVAVGGAE